MKEIILPSDDALRARSAEITTSKQEQEKAAWQAKVSELEANIMAIEQQIAALRARAELGDYRPDPYSPAEEWLAFRNEQRVRNARSIGEIRQAMAVLALRDNEPTVQRFRALELIDPHPGNYDSDLELVDGDYVTELLCARGDSVLYTEERSLHAPGDKVDSTRRSVSTQMLLSPLFERALIRPDICLMDTDAEGYKLDKYTRHSEVREAIDRARISRLLEWGAVELRQSGTPVASQYGKEIAYYEQTYTLNSGTTVVLLASFDSALSTTDTPDRQLADEQLVDHIEKLGVVRLGTASTEAGSISMNKKYLTADGRYGENGLRLEEAESLIAQIAAEKVS